MFEKVFNPFKYVAGMRSLILGLAFILATSILGFFSQTYFPDVISVKIGADRSFFNSIIQNFLNWFVVSTLFYLASIILSKSKIRIIDIFGTQALARFPYLFMALTGFSESMDAFGNHLLWKYLQSGEPIEISMIQKVMAISLMFVSALLTVWMVILMYNAFKVSANLKGPKLIWAFITVMILSMVILSNISKYLIF